MSDSYGIRNIWIRPSMFVVRNHAKFDVRKSRTIWPSGNPPDNDRIAFKSVSAVPGRNSVLVNRMAMPSRFGGTTRRRARARIRSPRSLTNWTRTLVMLASNVDSFRDFGVDDVFDHVPPSYGCEMEKKATPSPT